MKDTIMKSWEKYIDEANSYLKAATGAHKKARLGKQVVYNLLSMAIENYLTATCIHLGQMPEHSGITAMLRQVGRKIELPESFLPEAQFINSFMNFCSLEILETKEPTHPELDRMLHFANEIKQFCGKHLVPQTPNYSLN